MLLISAVRYGRTRQVQLLLKTGINVDLRDKKGRTALIHCCFIKDPVTREKVLKLLLAQRPKVNRKDHLGRSAFLWACFLGRAKIITGLINDPNSDVETSLRDNDGNGALMLAVKSGSLATVKTIVRILSHSSSRSRTSIAGIFGCNNAGICPLFAAFHREDFECAHFLVREGAPVSSLVNHLKCLVGREEEGLGSSRVFDFLAKSHDLVDNLTEKRVLEFLFDEKSGSSQTEQRSEGPPKTSSSEPDGGIVSTRATVGLNSRRSITTECLSTDIGTDSTGMDCDGNDGNSETSSGFIKPHEYDADFTSIQDSVLKLYDIYTEQLTPSYRKGMPTCRYKTPPPPPPPRKESKPNRPNRISLQHSPGSDMTKYLSTKRGSGGSDMAKYLSTKRGSATSSTGLPIMQESELDRQMRLKYARSSRAASVQVAKLPSIGLGGKKMKRTKSSTVMFMPS